MSNYFDNFGQDYISAMNNSIADAEVRANHFAVLPDGKYQMYVDSLEIAESQYDDGYPSFVMRLVVVEGDCRGRSVQKRYNLVPDPQSLTILKTDLSLLGVDLTSVIDLTDEGLMRSMLDKIVEVTIKTRVSKKNGKSYPNYYLNKVVGHMGDREREVDINDTPWGN